MKKIVTLLLLMMGLQMQAQHGVDWSVLNREWYINSAGYPADDPVLDKLYYRLHDFSLDLTNTEKFTMSFRADSVVSGTYKVNKNALTITFTIDGKSEVYAFLDVNKDVLSIQADENKTWAFFLNLTSHK